MNNRWAIIKSTVTKAASKTLKENKTTVPRKEWITIEIVNMIEERRKLKNETTLEHKWKYRELRNLVVRKSKEAKKKYLEEKCKDIEVQMRTSSRDAAYKSVKKFFYDLPKRSAIEDNKKNSLDKK